MGEEYVRVFATHSWLQGEIVKGRLEAEGVPVQLSGEHEGPYPVGPAELFVPPSFESQARRILAEIESGSYEVPDENRDPSE
jgi:Putative prokaryotic signal transducing protein